MPRIHLVKHAPTKLQFSFHKNKKGGKGLRFRCRILNYDHDGFKVQKWYTAKFLNRLQYEFEVKTSEEQGIRASSLAHNTLGVEGHAGAPEWD
jgi:hypothetical protein